MTVTTHDHTWTRSAVWLLLAVLLLGLIGTGVALRAAQEPNKQVPKQGIPEQERPRFEPGDLFDDLPGFDADTAELRKRFDQMREKMSRLHPELRLPGGVSPPRGGRLGALVAPPSATLVSQLDLPKDRGLVVEEVRGNSPAHKAGLQAHDILLEFAGKPVPSDPQAFVKHLLAIKTDTSVDAVILRKGKRETIKGLILPEVRTVPPGKSPPKEEPPPVVRPGQSDDRGSSITVNRNDDQFTATRRSGDVAITIRGKVEDGKAVAGTIEIQEGKKSQKYADLDKVPEAYRGQAKELLERVAAKPARPKVEDF